MDSLENLSPPDPDHGEAWYPDPLGSKKRQRYWDGKRWTTFTRTGGAPPSMGKASPGVEDMAPPPGADDGSGWYPDPLGATNRERFWSEGRWSTQTRSTEPKSERGARGMAQGALIAALGIGALILGLLLGFAAVSDESSPDFRENVNETARAAAIERYEQTETVTETVTREVTTARP